MEPWINGFVQLVQAVAWPATLLFVLWQGLRHFKAEFREFLQEVSAFIRRVKSIKATASGLEMEAEINRIEALTEALDARVSQVRQLAAESIGGEELDGDAKPEVARSAAVLESELVNLRRVAERYERANPPDRAERIRQKTALAEQLGNLVLRGGIPRDRLVEEPREGFAVALASAALLSPQVGDAKRLVDLCKAVVHRHAKYRITMAFNLLVNNARSQPMDEGLARQIRETIGDWERQESAQRRPDRPLLSRIRALWDSLQRSQDHSYADQD